MIHGEGKLHFDIPNKTRKHQEQAAWKKTAILLLDDETEDYYRWWLIKRFSLKLNKTLRGSHITIINDRVLDEVKYNEAVKLYEGAILKFKFHPKSMRSDANHWWINVDVPEAFKIREDAGLSTNPYYKFHLTIGLANSKHIGHSQYILDSCIKFNF